MDSAASVCVYIYDVYSHISICVCMHACNYMHIVPPTVLQNLDHAQSLSRLMFLSIDIHKYIYIYVYIHTHKVSS